MKKHQRGVEESFDIRIKRGKLALLLGFWEDGHQKFGRDAKGEKPAPWSEPEINRATNTRDSGGGYCNLDVGGCQHYK